MSITDTDSTSQLYDLSDSVALVTGATGQLGRPMCEALAEQGANVVVNARSASDCIALATDLTERYQRAVAAAGDVTDEEDVSQIVSTVQDEFDGLDVLINNAYSGSLADFEEMTVEQFQSAIDGALMSTFLCTRESLPLLREDGAAIINIASIYGLVAPNHDIYGDSGLNNPANYGAAKAGVIQLTRWIATRYAEQDIRANAITFGGFYNPELEERTDYTEEFVPNYEQHTPLGRMGNPEDVKGPVTFLASDASQWMTGQNLIVDGGWTTW